MLVFPARNLHSRHFRVHQRIRRDHSFDCLLVRAMDRPPALPPERRVGERRGWADCSRKCAVLTEGLEFPDIHIFEGFLHGFAEGLVGIAHAAL